MPSQRLHLIYAFEGPHGWSVSSPQLPGFFFHRPTKDELLADLPAALRFARAPAWPEAIHVENFGETPEGNEWVIRWEEDEHLRERTEGVRRVMAMLETEQRFDVFKDAPESLTGEVRFVVALGSDRLQSIYDQLDSRGEVVMLAVPVADEMIWSTKIGFGEFDRDDDWCTLEESGLTLESTVSELMVVDSSGTRALVLS